MKKARFEIIHEDDDILLVNKPTGMASIPERFVENDTGSVLSILRKQRPDLMTVHRIDKETSGLLLFAQNPDAHRDLSLQFEKREVEKHYLAIVDGRFSDKEGKIDKGISPDRSWAGKMKANPKGKSALTLYKVLEEFYHYTLVDIQIITGRTHQIRVHMSYIGHPLMVDELYGKRDQFMLSTVKRNYNYSKWENERPLVKRLTLHAFSMRFIHPGTKKEVFFEAPLPKDLRAALNQLRKWDSLEE